MSCGRSWHPVLPGITYGITCISGNFEAIGSRYSRLISIELGPLCMGLQVALLLSPRYGMSGALDCFLCAVAACSSDCLAAAA